MCWQSMKFFFFSSLFSLEHGIPNWLEATYRQQTKPNNTKPKSTNKWNSLLLDTENRCYTQYLLYIQQGSPTADHKAHPQAGEMAQEFGVQSWELEFRASIHITSPQAQLQMGLRLENGWGLLASSLAQVTWAQGSGRDLSQTDKGEKGGTPGILCRPPCKYTGMDSPLPYHILSNKAKPQQIQKDWNNPMYLIRLPQLRVRIQQQH